jgi:16S rRNA (guanine(1405)-N(7))-methyltransferase
LSARVEGDEVEAVVVAVGSSRRYRDVDPGAVARVAREELARSRSVPEAVKRTKRRLHQAVGAFRAPSGPVSARIAALRAAWHGRLDDPALREACATRLAAHASTRERVPHLAELYAGAWVACGGAPGSLLDLGCGIGPLALPWMGLSPIARYVAVDADGDALALVDGFLSIVGQPHDVVAADLAGEVPLPDAIPAVDVAILLKLVPTLDRRDPAAAGRLLAAARARHCVVSFPARSLGGRARGMEGTYRARLEALVSELAALGVPVHAVADVSIPGELVFVLAFDEARGG